MSSIWIAALIALFVWWFSTGAVLYVVRRTEKSGVAGLVACTILGLVLLGFGLWGFVASLPLTGVGAAYVAFLSAIAIWGWVELSFLTGTITGPNPHHCPDDLPGWERLVRAWGTIAYHEVLLTMVFAAIWLYGAGAENIVGVWTFTMLYLARISAKLNLFCGVPKINTEFLPEVLGHLPSHFKISKFNWLFPISITVLTCASALWIERVLIAESAGEAVGYALLSAITALALLEHWLMVLPLPDAKLWRWMLPSPKTPTKNTEPEGTHGF
ncbi:MAG: putative photosynthetic complex assembly protein PuhE [Pseudomonadota bacterium]